MRSKSGKRLNKYNHRNYEDKEQRNPAQQEVFDQSNYPIASLFKVKPCERSAERRKEPMSKYRETKKMQLQK